MGLSLSLSLCPPSTSPCLPRLHKLSKSLHLSGLNPSAVCLHCHMTAGAGALLSTGLILMCAIAPWETYVPTCSTRQFDVRQCSCFFSARANTKAVAAMAASSQARGNDPGASQPQPRGFSLDATAPQRLAWV